MAAGCLKGLVMGCLTLLAFCRNIFEGSVRKRENRYLSGATTTTFPMYKVF
jgi:hypothetical protein